MNIPEGFVLVPAEPTRIQLVAGLGANGIYPIYCAMVAAHPVEIPAYDEAKEREMFEAFYIERAKTLPLPLGKSPLRYSGGQYINDFALFGWMVWLACAQSRDGSVGDE